MYPIRVLHILNAMNRGGAESMDGYLRSVIENRIHQLGLDNSVILTGTRSDVLT